VSARWRGRGESLAEDDWLRILRVDLLGAFFFIKRAFRTMKPGSAVINVSSVHAVETTPPVAPYDASKSALLSLTRSAALEGKSKGRQDASRTGRVSRIHRRSASRSWRCWRS
jgi:NAD(P)-dependent dehydrogenase (short-subunit alcohol dehydrogenase family)